MSHGALFNYSYNLRAKKREKEIIKLPKHDVENGRRNSQKRTTKRTEILRENSTNDVELSAEIQYEF